VSLTLAQASLLAGILLIALAAFHAALASGAPLGAYAWGGSDEGVLPARLRQGSGLLALVILAMSVVVLVRGGWLYADSAREMIIPVWCIFVFIVLQVSGALRSAASKERRVMGPLYIVIAALLAYIGFGNPP
jgi:hypothetical protein